MCPEKIDGIVTLLSDFSGLIALRGINFKADLRLHVASKQSRHSEQLYICAGVPVSAAAVSRLPAFPFKHTNSLRLTALSVSIQNDRLAKTTATVQQEFATGLLVERHPPHRTALSLGQTLEHSRTHEDASRRGCDSQ